MDLDFKSSVPLPGKLQDCHDLITLLWQEFQDLNETVSSLKEQLNTNSSNSSLPPSKDSLKKMAEKRKERDAWRLQVASYWSNPRQGAQPGHRGSGRKLMAAKDVNNVIACHPDRLCLCGDGEIKTTHICQRKQVFDIISGALFITEYQIHGGRCCRCKKRCRGQLPEGTPRGILGASILAKVALLTGKYRLSKREVCEFLTDFFGLKFCVGTISNAERQVSQSLQSAVDEVGEKITEQAYLHVDETGHNHKGDLEWLWVATTQELSYYKIYQHRNQTSAKALIGEAFTGMIITDRYGAYNWLSEHKRQYCWAHLKRDFKKIEDRECVQESHIGYCLSDCLKWIFHHWRRIRDGTPNKYHRRSLRDGIKRLYQALRRGRCLTGTKTQRFCAGLLRNRRCLWHFLTHDGVEPTNNHAERQLRHAVIWRKKCYGTQSDRGIHFVERILTTIMTCKQQQRNALDFITECVLKVWGANEQSDLASTPSLLAG